MKSRGWMQDSSAKVTMNVVTAQLAVERAARNLLYAIEAGDQPDALVAELDDAIVQLDLQRQRNH